MTTTFMTPERYKKAGSVYDAALQLKRESRKAFVEMECGGDEELRREVESLLGAHDKVGDFFESPALEVAAGLIAKQENPSLMGRSFSHYRVFSMIGVGGMGEVYLAEDTKLGRRVALKMLPNEFTPDHERVRRFEQEARAASALNHPNIVTIYEVGQVNGRHFIATEYIEGETLRARLSAGQIELEQAIEVALQISSALHAAHEAGIVHRDIKPENVMVRRDGLLKILDFGLAKLAENKQHNQDSGPTTQVDTQSTPGLVIGTLRYMSPEQARGERLDERSDIFSLGVLIYEMLAGQSPFAAASGAETLVSILDREPTPLSQCAPNVPAGIERIVDKALRKNKEERYKTAGELAKDLKDLKREIDFGTILGQRTAGVSGSKSVRTTDGSETTGATGENKAVRTDDVVAGKTTEGAGYLINELKRRKVSVAIATAVLIVVAAFSYSFFAKSTGKAEKVVAVLPFVNATGDPNTEYLSVGISDGIIGSLSRMPNIKVISLNAALRYKGQQPDPKSIGRELNVEAVLMGSLTQLGDGLSINAELVDARNDRRLWSERYERKLKDVYALEQGIVREIAASLRLTLDSKEERRLTKRYTTNSEANKAYRLGSFMLKKRTGPATEKSIEHFQQAIKLDPQYALAYATLADAHISLVKLGGASLADALPKAKEAVEKALKIDDEIAEAHASLGSIRFFESDWHGAEEAFKRAYELNPSYGRNQSDYEHYLRAMKRFADAVDESKRVAELEPDSPFHQRSVAMALYFARNFDEAIEQCQKALELDANMPTTYRWLAKSYEQKGDYDQAVDAYLKTAEFTQLGPEAVSTLRETYAASGWNALWQKLIALKNQQAKQPARFLEGMAESYARLRDKDQVIALLEQSFEQHMPLVTIRSRDPAWDIIRSDPRYADLMRRLGLEL